MQRMGVSLIIAVIALGFAAAKPTPAHAQFEYCNQTSYYLFTALGHEARGGNIRTEGWWLVRPGECRVVEREELGDGAYFTYAESHPAHQGGIRTWGGRSRLCTNRGLFTIDEQSSCFQRGFEPREFARINVGEETSWTTNLTESANYQAESARHAAAQRLLNDLGYNAGSVDGYLGRRTRSAINRFKADHGIEDDTIVSNELLDALIAQAAENQELSGYQFCNRTDIELYAAMGYTEDDAWRTEGWWALEPGTCTKALNDSLPAEQIYTYAVGYDPEGAPIEFGGDYPLCTGDQAFEIVGNGDCESRGYITVGFERVETEGRSGWVQEFVLDNGQPRAGMRNMQAEVNGAAPN
jgi:uncharacterized membrane protein